LDRRKRDEAVIERGVAVMGLSALLFLAGFAMMLAQCFIRNVTPFTFGAAPVGMTGFVLICAGLVIAFGSALLYLLKNIFPRSVHQGRSAPKP
jgi:hypothetical protein